MAIFHLTIVRRDATPAAAPAVSRGDGRTRRAGGRVPGWVGTLVPAALATGPRRPVGCSCRSGCLALACPGAGTHRAPRAVERAIGIERHHPPTTTNFFLPLWLLCPPRGRHRCASPLGFNTLGYCCRARLAATASASPASSRRSRSSGRGVRGDDEAASGPAGAAPDGQRRHGRHHARLPLRPHLHQGPILLQPLPYVPPPLLSSLPLLCFLLPPAFNRPIHS
jgi:hypothetical protein